MDLKQIPSIKQVTSSLMLDKFLIHLIEDFHHYDLNNVAMILLLHFITNLIQYWKLKSLISHKV